MYSFSDKVCLREVASRRVYVMSCDIVVRQCSLAFTPPPPNHTVSPPTLSPTHVPVYTHSLVEGLQPVQNFLEPDKSELLVKQTPAVPSKEQEEFSICVPVTEADGNGVVGGGDALYVILGECI